MDPRAFETFEEFWDYYVAEHANPTTRMLHFVGTTAAMGCVAGAIVFRKKWLLLAAPVVGYAPAWASHFFVEKNRPATFGHPLWSLRADLRMWWKTVRGEMQAEVDRVVGAADARESGTHFAPDAVN
jgi:hypothetical protein